VTNASVCAETTRKRQSSLFPPSALLKRRLVFVGSDRFHQRHELTLHGLVLDLAVGPEQPQAERAVQEQKALDFPRLGVAVVEERDGHIERGGDLLKTSSADAVHALLVLLDLLEADPQLQKGIEAMPQARALYQNARKIVAQRTGGPSDQP